jgi:hypothetical protein
VAIATFWRTFHHDGKISPAWWGYRCTPTPFHDIYCTITYKWCGLRSSWEGRYTPPISTLPLYVLCVQYGEKPLFVHKRTLSLHCQKSLFVLASRQKILLLKTENPLSIPGHRVSLQSPMPWENTGQVLKKRPENPGLPVPGGRLFTFPPGRRIPASKYRHGRKIPASNIMDAIATCYTRKQWGIGSRLVIWRSKVRVQPVHDCFSGTLPKNPVLEKLSRKFGRKWHKLFLLQVQIQSASPGLGSGN